ncbi:MAG: hypothetical protein F4Y44_03040 [Chloroflexi bacterium]|nr:hypothetical protein [Chloroflexota bacterium]
MRHFTKPSFWQHYRRPPAHIHRLGDENFQIPKQNPRHPSLQFKKVGDGLCSEKGGIRYRALAYEHGLGFVWFWIVPHAEYNRGIR